MVETKDISIGQDKWIKWVELDANDNNLFEIDPLLGPTKEFWQRLETECMAECCGIDAFGLWPDDILSAAKEFNIEELKAAFLRLKNEIVQTPCKTVVSKRLNNLLDKQIFLRIIDHILSCL